MKLTKRILAAVTAASCVFCINFAGWERTLIVNAADYSDPFKYGDYLNYRQIDEDEDGIYDYIEISSCDESAVSVEIPSEIDGFPVKSIGNYAFQDCNGLTSIEIPDGVMLIGHNAFKDCSGLTSIYIPESVIFIGDSAFDGCSGLTGITIPGSVTNIGGNAFYETPWLKAKQEESPLVVVNNILIDATTCSGDVVIPDGITTITDCAFAYSENLKSVTIPDSVTSIGEYAFTYCSNLASITIPESVTNIGGNAFYETPWLKVKQEENPLVVVNNILIDGTTCSGDVIIPDGVTSIASYAFAYSENLKSVTISDSVTSIGFRAFQSCISLESVTIPDSVTNIRYDTFNNCISLDSIIIPDSITRIDLGAFYNCSSLTSIEIPNGVTLIGDSAFYNCSSLTSINIPNSVKSIEDSAFYNCTNLESITIDNPECDIDDSSWTICNGRDDQIEDYYFNGTIYGYKDSTAQAYAEKYGYNFKLIDEIPDVTEPTEPTEPTESVVTTSVTTTASVETSATNITATELSDYLSYKKVDEDEDGIYDYIEISSCDESAVSVEIPSEIDGLTVKSIGDSAFSGCSSLISMEIPDSITSIGDCAFLNCSSLTNINVSENNKDYSSIDGILFNKDKTELIQYPQSSEIIEYIIPDSVTSIKNMAFFDCSSLASVTIPESVISIEFATFRGCSSLESITIPDSVTNIGNWAFRDCSSLTSIEIPNNVTSIGNSAFEGCSSLTSINVSENNKDYSSIDGILFNKDKTLLIRYPQSSEITEYIVPNSVICIEDDAFSDCSSLTSVTILDSVTVIRYGAFFGCSSLESITIPDGVSTIDNSTFCNCTNLESITIENPKCEIFDALLTICNGRDDQTGDYYFNGTIYGYKDSTAQAYAEKYERKFAEINNAEVDGDSNGDGVLNVRDCAFIASALAKGNGDSLPMSSDFNKDGKVNVRDAAAIASYLAKGGK